MSIIDSLLGYFKQNPEADSAAVPEGLCPNCWGKQEYGDTVRTMYRDKQIDVNNHSANYAFIQDFVVNHVDGIRLKKGNNGYQCPTCKTVVPE